MPPCSWNTARPLLLVSALAATSLLGACKADQAPAATAAAPPAPVAAQSAKPELGSFGFDVSGMDRSIKPGDDFFAYANGTWVAKTEIPADRSSYGSFTVLAERAAKRTRSIIEEAAANQSAGGDTRKIGDFYTELVREWFQAFAMNAGVCLHLELLYGENSHHIAEASFKSLARALRAAAVVDDRLKGQVASTKGSL